jgi:hypothetical protein
MALRNRGRTLNRGGKRVTHTHTSLKPQRITFSGISKTIFLTAVGRKSATLRAARANCECDEKSRAQGASA